MRIIGVVLIVLGLAGLVFGGIKWKQPETVLDIGSVKVTHDEKKSLPVSPIAGGLCLAAGVVMLVARTRRTA